MTVEKILKQKGTHSPVVGPTIRIAEMIEVLEKEEVGALVVSSGGRKIDGIISERDVIRGLCKFGATVLEKTVSELMTKDVVTCIADDSLAGVMALMADKNFRHVPVIDNDELAGIVSIRDIIQLRLDEVQADADAMRDYISRA